MERLRRRIAPAAACAPSATVLSAPGPAGSGGTPPRPVAVRGDVRLRIHADGQRIPPFSVGYLLPKGRTTVESDAVTPPSWTGPV